MNVETAIQDLVQSMQHPNQSVESMQADIAQAEKLIAHLRSESARFEAERQRHATEQSEIFARCSAWQEEIEGLSARIRNAGVSVEAMMGMQARHAALRALFDADERRLPLAQANLQSAARNQGEMQASLGSLSFRAQQLRNQVEKQLEQEYFMGLRERPKSKPAA